MMSESATKIKSTTTLPNSNRKRTPSSTTRTQKTPSSTVKLLLDSIVKGLEFVRFGIPANPTHPILSNILLSMDKELQQVRLTSNTLEFSTTFTLEGKIDNDAKIALPINAFQQIVKKLSPGEIQLKINIATPELEDTPLDIQLSVTGDRSTKFNFRGTNTQSFPLLTSNNLQPIATIKAKTLIHQLGTSVFAANPKDGQRILQGTHLIFSRDTKQKLIQLETWTTNGSCLALTKNY
jgi:DNA polymerase-3 subunit beta